MKISRSYISPDMLREVKLLLKLSKSPYSINYFDNFTRDNHNFLITEHIDQVCETLSIYLY